MVTRTRRLPHRHWPRICHRIHIFLSMIVLL
jgi:hypothetical protein